MLLHWLNVSGYGKYEAVGSLSVGAILVLCGIGIGADGLQALQEIWNGATAAELQEFSLPFLPGALIAHK
jgi:divalent metal cation (Fe/Co/Zn/Cd) transporter